MYEFWKKYVNNLLNAAMFWFGFGLSPIPVIPNTKRTAVPWDDWLDCLKSQQIAKYWKKYPNHEVGCIVGGDLIVFDADTIEALIALVNIEARFGVMPKMVVKTTRGQHHYFRRAPGTVAKSDSHDSEKYPDRIDIKTGRALAILPISSGKTLHMLDAENTDGLSEITQEFIDAIYEHNGRTAPSKIRELSFNQDETNPASLQNIESLLEHINPDIGYEGWLRVGMAIYHETHGSDEGMALFDSWSRRVTNIKELRTSRLKIMASKFDSCFLLLNNFFFPPPNDQFVIHI